MGIVYGVWVINGVGGTGVVWEVRVVREGACVILGGEGMGEG